MLIVCNFTFVNQSPSYKSSFLHHQASQIIIQEQRKRQHQETRDIHVINFKFITCTGEFTKAGQPFTTEINFCLILPLCSKVACKYYTRGIHDIRKGYILTICYGGCLSQNGQVCNFVSQYRKESKFTHLFFLTASQFYEKLCR